MQCVPYVLMSAQEHFPLMWKIFRYYVTWSALCTGKSTRPLPHLHSYSICIYSVTSAPKVAEIMSPSENSFRSFCKGLLLSAEFWLSAVGLGQAESEASHVQPICLCHFSWQLSQTTSSSSLGVAPRCSPHQFIKHTQEGLKPSFRLKLGPH